MLLNLVWIIFKANNQIAKEEACFCSEQLNSLGINVLNAPIGANDNPTNYLFSKHNQLPNLAIVLGGDGTVLGAARSLAIHKIPLLCFNVGGHLGFLTNERILLRKKETWEEIQSGEFKLEKRMMLEAKNYKPTNSDQNLTCLALNDFYFRAYRDEVSPTCILELEVDGEKVDEYRGDGLILATPTGSTAYSMATGGPILHPQIEAIVVNPISPMSLSSRPIVVPPESLLQIKPLGDKTRRVKLWKDGASESILDPGESCVVKRAKHHALMIILKKSPSYYQTITQKLHWAGSFSQNNS